MADAKASAFPTVSTMATSDVLPVITGIGGTPAQKVITKANFKTDLALVKGDVGLGNVDNTADASKTVAAANALKSATTTVDTSAATAPTSGQVLTATGTTAANWQTPAGGGGQTLVTKVIAASGGDYTTLAAALAAASAGWTIWVINGTFALAANLSSSLSDLTIIGANRSKAIIDTNGFTLTLDGTNVSVRNLGVTAQSSANAALLMTNSINSSVEGCNLIDNGAASAFRFGDQAIVTRNHIYANASSTELSLAGTMGTFANNYIERSVAAGNTVGDANVGGSKWTITGNTFNNSSAANNGSRYFMALTNSDCTVTGNGFFGTGTAQAGIRIDGNDNIVTGNQIKNATTNHILINTGATSNRVYGNNLHGGTVTDNGTTSIVASAAN